MDFSFFDPIIEFFQFVSTLIETLVNGIYGIISIINGLISLIIKIIGVLPDSMAMITYVFVSIFTLILTYKIIRKG